MGCASTIIIDEAQRVGNIGMTLKLFGDMNLDAQIYVTGSSSPQLADDINEPATPAMSSRKARKSISMTPVYAMQLSIISLLWRCAMM